MQSHWAIIIMVGSVVGILAPLTYWVNVQENLDSKMVDSLNILLLAGFIVEGVVLFFVQNLIESKRYSTSRKERHAKDLVNKVLKRLAKLGVLTETDHKQYPIIPKIEKTHDDEENSWDEEDDSQYDTISKLPKPYVDWALKHLEKYDEIKESLESVYKLTKKHNELLDVATETVRNHIRDLFSRHFPNIPEQNENDKIGYDLQNITGALSGRLYVDSLDLPTEYPEDEEEGIKITLDVFEKNGVCRIGRIGYHEDTFVLCKSKDDLNLKQLTKLLETICIDENIIKQFKETAKMDKQCQQKHDFFREEMQMLIEHLISGIELKGKCAGCPK